MNPPPNVGAPGDAHASLRTGARPQTFTEIDLGALRRNFSRLCARLNPAARIIFAMKKNAYGHGLVESAHALAGESRLWALGVATAEEGLRLRHAGIQTEILVLSSLGGDELSDSIANDLTLTVTTAADAGLASRAASDLGRTARAHLKIDTGMGRLGVTPPEALRDLPRILDLPDLRLAAFYTHLPDGWEDPASALRQANELNDFCARAGLIELPRHIGGSDALAIADQIGPMSLRAGIAIYGVHPGIAGLEPAMSFKSRIIYRRWAAAGTKISYGSTYTLEHDTQLALVGAGYGNGYPVSLSSRGHVLIGGIRCPVLGRVCMDQIIVDVSAIPEARQGDEVVLFGSQNAARIGVEEVAAWARTIPYELLLLAGQINPRFYKD